MPRAVAISFIFRQHWFQCRTGVECSSRSCNFVVDKILLVECIIILRTLENFNLVSSDGTLFGDLEFLCLPMIRSIVGHDLCLHRSNFVRLSSI